MNIAKNLENAALYFPERTAVIDGDREITYSEFNQESNKIATSLLKKGVQPGDHIAILAPNSYAWLAFYFGVIKAGAVSVTLSNTLTKHELPPILDNCKPRMIFTSDEKLDALGDLGQYPYLKNVICDGGDTPYSALLREGSPSFAAMERNRDDAAAILYTSGTTGMPKGAVLTHQNLQASSHNIAHHERSTEKDRGLCFLPLNHVFGQVHITSSTIYSAGSLVIQPSYNMDHVLDAIKRLQVTKFYAVPTIFIRLLNLDDIRERFASVRYCFSAAASMAAEVVKEWKNRTGLDIYESYGMTESAAMVTYNHYYRHVVGSVGTPVNIVDVQIRDHEGNALPRGSEGEICISGPNIMKGYLDQPEATKAAFWGNWFRSGDIGVMDETGHVYIKDRLKDLIITGGENVYPREVEEVLYTREEVEECTVIGLPDKEYGERVVAYIVPRAGKEIDPASFKTYLKNRLSPFKVPKEYVAVAELPKSSTGKILKREIRQQAQTERKL